MHLCSLVGRKIRSREIQAIINVIGEKNCKVRDYGIFSAMEIEVVVGRQSKQVWLMDLLWGMRDIKEAMKTHRF